MDHTYITGVGLLFILVDSFSGCPEVIRVPDKKSSTIKHIGGKNGSDCKNRTESMISAKRKNRSFSTKAAFKLSHNTIR